ncbi:MAG: S-layer homology domain-containing protein [Sporomusaceae bacterium]|nr:S-layer homology domain-containing protein [Sporomusaceae bacterium]
MKKTLVTLLALVFVLGIAGTAFAAPANPFVDVPAKHWAYGAVAKLAKAGVVDGYGDGTFRGDRTMTRYEMAQVVAKAMAKSEKADAETKALIDKLAVEFAAELNNLGVRVAKLEKNASTIKMSGDARLRYIHQDKGAANPSFAQRFRLVAQADVNDTTSFYGRWMVLNHNTMGTYNTAASNVITDANLTMKGFMPNFDLKAGRYSLNLGETTYYAGTTGGFDGVELTWKQGKAAFNFGYADVNATNYYSAFNTWAVGTGPGNVMYANLAYKFDSQVKAQTWFMKNQDNQNGANDWVNVFGVGTTVNLGKDWAFVADYWKNTAAQAKAMNNGSAPKGVVYRLQYGQMKAAVPGTWQAHIEYTKMENGANDLAFTGGYLVITNVKSYDVSYYYTLAKNVTMEAIYQWDMKNALTGAKYFNGEGSSRTRIQFNYIF